LSRRHAGSAKDETVSFITFYKDGLASRPLVPGTVPRGWLREDKEFFTGKKSGAGKGPGQSAEGAPVVNTPTATATSTQTAAAYPDDVDKFPFSITKEMIKERGQQRYEIFCSVCHGRTGEGDGMIVRRGFRTPPSFFEANLRQAPVGHFFDVVTNGWGAMPSYAAQIPVQDRWLIIAYVRALQRTRAAAATNNPPATPVASPTSGEHK
jgi:mono/diheme cytochrome c family protein